MHHPSARCRFRTCIIVCQFDALINSFRKSLSGLQRKLVLSHNGRPSPCISTPAVNRSVKGPLQLFCSCCLNLHSTCTSLEPGGSPRLKMWLYAGAESC